tara:strand:- start:270 stop:1253 length:984 start_codon:yes stop_codon:yes gene_type:complete
MSRGGGGGHQTAETTSYTSTLPEYFEPYATAMASRAQTESLQGYSPYSGQRMAGFSPEEQAAMSRTAAYGSGGPSIQEQLATRGIAEESRGVNPLGMGIATGFDPQMFTSDIAQNYMSPYMQQVVDVQKREAARDAELQMNKLQSSAGQAGAYGGYRHGQQESNLRRQLSQQLGDIQARGSAAGYEDAYNRFIGDRSARLQKAELGLKGLGVDQTSRQLRQNALGQMAALSPQAEKSQMERLSALQGIGMTRRGMDQEQMDMSYQDFLNQRDYPKEQIEWYSQILRGLAPQPNQQVETFSKRPGAFQSLAGLGLGGLGLYKSLQGMG